MITISRFITGPIETNSYLLADEKKNALVFDPSSGCEEIIGEIRDKGLKAEAIVLTHGHFDHILGLDEIIDALGPLPVYIHPADRSCLTDPMSNLSAMMGGTYVFQGDIRELQEGNMTIGSFEFTVLNIPGHTPGGCAFVIENNCICGDVLFAGSVGRCDFPGGDSDLLIRGIRAKLMTLPDETIVHPGHNNRTTIGREKKSNPFLRQFR